MIKVSLNIWDNELAMPILSRAVRGGIDRNILKMISQDLYDRYCEPHRIYHTAYHVWYVYHSAMRLGVELTISQELAILYHDAIYEFGKHKDNEYASANLLRKDLGSLAHKQIIDTASKIVEDTAEHFQLEPKVSHLGKLVLDLDIAPLYGNFDEYLKWNQAVAEEYGGTPEDDIKFLEFFLSKPQILLSDELKDCEDRLRKNLNKMIVLRKKDVQANSAS